MNDLSQPPTPVSDSEMANLRQNIKILIGQAQSSHIDPTFLVKQLQMFSELIERLDYARQQHFKGQQFEALYNVSHTIGSSLELQTVLDQIMDALIHLTRAERGFLMMRDDDGMLAIKAARNFDQETLHSADASYSRTIAHQVLDEGNPIVTTNAIEDPRFAHQASIVGQGLRSVMSTPLRAHGSIIGVAYVDSSAVAGLFGQNDLDAMDALGGQAAIALENALMFGATDLQLAERVEALQQLRRIDLLLNQTLDDNEIMRYTLEWACRLSGAVSGHLALMDANSGRPQAKQHYGFVPGVELPKYLDTAYPDVADKLDGLKAHKIEHVEGEHHLIVPIRREQNTIGVLLLNGDTFTLEKQDLVERVAARAAISIENARLYRAVQEADTAKSEFVGIVAHDLKVPMTSIMGYADLTLMDGGLTDEQVRFLETVKSTVIRMEKLVSDLADISRIESGHFLMDESRVKVSHIVQAVEDATHTEISKREHTFIVDSNPDLPALWVDYYRLVQVLVNLVSNAYKYTPNGGTITLRIRHEDKRVTFSVADTGIGMTEETIANLGQKFWRANNELTRAQPGTGLGFAITRNLVDQMGSELKIDSHEGQGSHFTFSVPVAEAE